MGKRKCSKCGGPVNIYNPSHICYKCQDKLATERWKALDRPFVDVKQIAEVLDLYEEQVRRLYRDGRLPSPLALTRKLKWDKEFFLSWIRSQHKVPHAGAL